jgi:hypothetical protein
VEPYVTPERFKTMGFGVDLDAVEDFELRAVLRRASDRVNSMTAAPGLPVPHDFRGGSITAEEHHWDMGNGVTTGPSRTVHLWHTPILSVSDLRIRLTNTQGIVFDSAELMVFDKEVEIVSLAMTSAGLFGSYVVPEIGLAEPRVQADYTYGYRIPITRQTLDPTDGKTFRAQDQWWIDDSENYPVTVYDEAGTAIESGYTVHHDEGTIEFSANRDPDSVVYASFTSRLPRGISTATGILAAEALGDRETRARGMSGLRSIRVGEIELEKEMQMRGGTTLVTPAVAEAEALLDPYRFIWVGA